MVANNSRGTNPPHRVPTKPPITCCYLLLNDRSSHHLRTTVCMVCVKRFSKVMVCVGSNDIAVHCRSPAIDHAPLERLTEQLVSLLTDK